MKIPNGVWLTGSPERYGYEKLLMEYCLADARESINPAFACLEQRNKKTDSPINHLPGSSVLRLLMLPTMDMNCYRLLLRGDTKIIQNTKYQKIKCNAKSSVNEKIVFSFKVQNIFQRKKPFKSFVFLKKTIHLQQINFSHVTKSND
jgi:hypothetical protein